MAGKADVIFGKTFVPKKPKVDTEDLIVSTSCTSNSNQFVELPESETIKLKEWTI